MQCLAARYKTELHLAECKNGTLYRYCTFYLLVFFAKMIITLDVAL